MKIWKAGVIFFIDVIFFFVQHFNSFQIGKHKTSLLKDIAPAIQRKLIICKDAAAGESGSTERWVCCGKGALSSPIPSPQ